MKQIFQVLIFSILCLGCKRPEQKQPVVFVPEHQVAVAQAKQDTVPADHFCKTIAIPGTTARATGMRGKYWTNGQTVRVGFIGGTQAKKQFVYDGLSAWAKVVNLNFTYPSAGPYDLRVAFVAGSGSWSYVGTDCKAVAQNQPTTNLGWDGLDVALHELGHWLGMAHEQSSPNSTICWNKEKVYQDLGGPPNYWSKATVDYNVFRKLTELEAEATTFDPLSIMQYSVPGTWTCDGKGIPGGKTISALDATFMALKYPKPNQPPPSTKVALEKWKRDTIVKWLTQATPIQ